MVHIARTVKSRIFGFWGLEKSENFCEKMIFAKIILFFVGSFWVEILRLAHSLGVCGCLGCSKHRQFHENLMDFMILTRILLVPLLFLFSRLESSWVCVHLEPLNIRDYPLDNLRTCLKMTVWWLFIEQKIFGKYFSAEKIFVEDFPRELIKN